MESSDAFDQSICMMYHKIDETAKKEIIFLLELSSQPFLSTESKFFPAINRFYWVCVVLFNRFSSVTLNSPVLSITMTSLESENYIHLSTSLSPILQIFRLTILSRLFIQTALQTQFSKAWHSRFISAWPTLAFCFFSALCYFFVFIFFVWSDVNPKLAFQSMSIFIFTWWTTQARVVYKSEYFRVKLFKSLFNWN